LLGTLILWFGWYGFNPGSAFVYGGEEYGDILMSLAAVNSTVSAGAAGCTALFVEFYFTSRMTGKGRFDLLKTLNGVLAGLVAITAGCGVVEPWAAVIIGFFAGILYLFSSWLLVQLRLDDAVDAIPVHMINGIWGMIAVGLFASPERLNQAFGNGDYPGFVYPSVDGKLSGALLGAQLVGILCIMGWSIGTMMPFFMFLESIGSFRVAAREEVAGLDKHYFGAQDDGITDEQIVAMTRHVADYVTVQQKRDRIDESGFSTKSTPDSPV
jgi:Amt family ammonium transporter